MMLFSNNAKGQAMTDRIFKKDKTVLFVTFLREQDDSIQYQNFEDKRKVIHSLLKTDVDKVVLKNGQTISFEPVFTKRDRLTTIDYIYPSYATKEQAMADRIFKKDSTVVFGTVLGERNDSILYRFFEQENSSIHTIHRLSVYKIVLKNGRTFLITENPIKDAQRVIDSIDRATNALKRAFKFTPTAFMFGYTTLAFEKSLRHGRSVEVKLGLVGLGISNGFFANERPLGTYGTVGYKFIFQSSKTRILYHDLAGSYLRPELSIGYYSVQYKNNVYTDGISTVVLERHKIGYALVGLTFGEQSVTSKGRLIELFMNWSFGQSVESTKSAGVTDRIKYGNRIPIVGLSNLGNSFRVGLYIGSLLKNKKK